MPYQEVDLDAILDAHMRHKHAAVGIRCTVQKATSLFLAQSEDWFAVDVRWNHAASSTDYVQLAKSEVTWNQPLFLADDTNSTSLIFNLIKRNGDKVMRVFWAILPKNTREGDIAVSLLPVPLDAQQGDFYIGGPQKDTISTDRPTLFLHVEKRTHHSYSHSTTPVASSPTPAAPAPPPPPPQAAFAPLSSVKRKESLHPEIATLYDDVRKHAPGGESWSMSDFLDKMRMFEAKFGWALESVGVSWQDLIVEAQEKGSDKVPTVATKAKHIFASSTTRTTRLVDRVSGYVKPGHMLLFLGTPDSGCTTVMRALAGMLDKGAVDISGSILYNGEPGPGEYRPRVRFVGEDDTHIPSLTVHQTLRFAGELSIPPEFPLRDEMLENFVTDVEHILGIHHVRNTVVGNEVLRGVSGGEKKRVTIAEMLISRCPIMFLDNFSKGLDAAASLDIVKGMREVSRFFSTSFVATMYQASEEIVRLYDNICLMREGRCIYFGPPQQALGYFEELGFVCPPRRTFVDFLTSIGDGSIHDDELPASGPTHFLVTRPEGLDLYEEPQLSAVRRNDLVVSQGDLFASGASVTTNGSLFMQVRGAWACVRSPPNTWHVDRVALGDCVMFGRHGPLAYINGVYTARAGDMHDGRPIFRHKTPFALDELSSSSDPAGAGAVSALTLHYHAVAGAWILSNGIGRPPLAMNESTAALPSNLQTPWKVLDASLWGTHRADPAVRFVQLCTPPASTDDLTEAFERSTLRQHVGTQIPLAVALPPSNTSEEFEAFSLRAYAVGKAKQARHLVAREFVLLKKDPAQIVARYGRFLFLGLLIGALFWQMSLDAEGLYNRGGMLFFSSLLVSTSAFGFLPIMMQNRSIFYKQKAAYFFTPRTYFMSILTADVPFVLLEVVIFGNIIYWMTGLQVSFLHYLYYLLCLFVADLCVSTYIRMATTVMSTPASAEVLASSGIIFPILFCGYLIPRPEIPSHFIWIHYLSPFKYIMEGLFINEFNGITFDIDGSTLDGATYLDQRFGINAPDLEFYKWMMLLVLLGFTTFFAIVAMYGLSRYTFGSSAAGTTRVYYARKRKYARLFEGLGVTATTDTELVARSRPNGTSGNPNNSNGRGKAALADGINGAAYDAEETRDDGIAAAAALATTSLSAPEPTTIVMPSLLGGKARADTVFSWHDLSYEVDLPKGEVAGNGGNPRKLLLDSVNGFVRSGSLVALMGASGAGKTTLLDVLARRKTGGHVTGQIMINGVAQDASFSHMCGYVEQSDIHSPRTTVREAIMFSAALRLPKQMSDAERRAKVVEIADVLGLTPLLDAVIGSPDIAGALAPDARKRVTIAVELVTSPAILFLDEPTSGLSSSAALTVMRAARQAANLNCAVVCTIHQPSAELFEMFDSLLLLQKGGKTAYFGPIGTNSSQLLHYFEASGAPSCGNANPADYILVQIGAGIMGHADRDWGVVWGESDMRARMLTEMEDSVTAANSALVRNSSHEQPTFSTQVRYLLRRCLRTYWRDPSYNFTRIVFSLCAALLFGLTYLRLGNTQAELQGRVAVFFFSLVLGMVALLNSMGPMLVERAVYYREKSAKAYNALAYHFATGAVETPFIVLTSLLFCLVVYWLVGFRTEAFPYFFLMYLTMQWFCISLGQLLAVWAPTAIIAKQIGPAIFSLWNLFVGFLIPKPSIPGYFIWLHYVNPLTYYMEGVVSNELHGQEYTCGPNESPCYTNGDDMLDFFGMDYSNRWRNFFILLAFLAAVRIITWLGLEYKMHQKR